VFLFSQWTANNTRVTNLFRDIGQDAINIMNVAGFQIRTTIKENIGIFQNNTLATVDATRTCMAAP
jgi:hypothetical protein